jgi:hypothetical protein
MKKIAKIIFKVYLWVLAFDAISLFVACVFGHYGDKPQTLEEQLSRGCSPNLANYACPLLSPGSVDKMPE